MKKRISRNRWMIMLIMVVLLAVGRSSLTLAAENENVGSRVIRVGYTDKGQMILKKDGRFVGYGVAYLQKLSSFTGWTYEYIPVEEEDRIQKLLEGEFDLLCDISMDEAGADQLLLSSQNSCMNYALLCAKLDDDSVFFNEYELMNGKRIAVNESRKMKRMMDDFSDEFGISYTPVYCGSLDEMETAVENGWADLLVASNQRQLDDYKYVAKIGLRDQYFAVAPGNRELMRKLNVADWQIKLNQPFFIASLYETYYGRPSDTLIGVTREEYEFVQSGTTVRVACDDDSFPLEYLDKNGKYCGVYADAMKLISRKSGLHFEYYPTKGRSAWDVMDNREVDMSVGMYVDNELKEAHGFLASTAHMIEDYTLIARAAETLEGTLQIAMPEELVGIREFVSKNYPNYQIVTCENNEQGLEMTESGKVDGTLINSIFLQTVFNLNNYPGLIALPMHTIEIPISCTFTGPNAEVICRIVDKTVRQTPKQRFEECIIENAVKIAYEPTTRDIVRRVMPYTLLGITLFSIIYLLTIWGRERHYRNLSMTDILTGILNGRSFRKEAKVLLSQKNQKNYQLISFDMERFKYVNHDFGEKTADQFLKEIADRLRNIFGSHALYARDMGDLFLILTEKREDIEEVLGEVGHEIYFENNGIRQHYKPELKFGICNISDKNRGLEINDYINYASAARRFAKGNSAQEFAYFDKEMQENVSHVSWIEKRMETALKEREFMVYYQPKYSFRNNHITGAEALVRWKSPERGIMPPNSFIPIFERNGFIIQLDFFVYEETLKTIAEWRNAGGRDIVISVNVSRAHIDTGDFLTKLVELVDQYEVPHRLFELELTETIAGGKRQDVVDFIWKCKKAGFPISIDDFGSGYSSLNLLKELPVDVLKIDREFLNESGVSEKSSIIIEQIVNMASKLKIHTLCEGVETQDQAEFLKRIGCDTAQGYLYSRPVPLNDFRELLWADQAV